MKGDKNFRSFYRHSNETVTLRKHVTKYKNMRKLMVEFLRKFENRGIKNALVKSILNSKSVNGHIGTLMRSSLQNLALPQYLSVFLWNDLTPYSMVWDRRVPRAGPVPFYWPGCSLSFSLLLFSLSLLSFYVLVVSGWDLWTDRGLIALKVSI